MFHTLNDSLIDTRNRSKPAYFLSASRIAKIIACIETGTILQEETRNIIIEVSPDIDLFEGLIDCSKPWYRESGCSKTSLRAILALLIGSVEESNRGLYFPNCTQAILLAFLWKRAQGNVQRLTMTFSNAYYRQGRINRLPSRCE